MYVKMMFSVVLMIGAGITLAAGKDCTLSNLLLDPGQEGINASEASSGVYLSPFPMPAYIYNNSGDMLHVSVYQRTRTCLSVSGEPDCTNDFRVDPSAFDTGPPIERGTIYYRHTTDQSELISLADYLCPGFIARHAVIITYFCLGEISGNISETVQVIVTTGEDSEGVNRTIVLTTLGQFWRENTSPYVEIGRTGFFYYYTIFENQTKGFDITYLTGWASSPQVVPEIPATCPPPAARCQVTLGGHLTEFDGGEQDLTTTGKLTLAEWNPGKIDCKFKLIANIDANNHVKWVRFAVGPHKRQTKYFRLIDFNRSPGKIEQRGWKCKAGCQGIISSFDHDIENEDGTVYATVREIDPGNTYVIDTQLCSDVNDPNYKMTFHFNANANEIRASLELSHQFYVDNQNQLTGYCLQ